MSDDVNNKNTLSLNEKIKLINEHPCFFSLSAEDTKELALLSTEYHFSRDYMMMREGDFIDAVYLIAQGKIEVSKARDNTRHDDSIPIAILDTGDAIGLNRTGFFAESGFRTATLMTLTDVIIIGWQLNEFYEFIKKHPALSSCMKTTAEIMIRMNFIKHALPFTHLPKKYLAELSKAIKEIDVKKGTIIFSEGDHGDECYLIYSGKVEILTNNDDGSLRILSILETPSIFGEVAILSDLPRNATAKMIETGKLLAINKINIKKIIKQCKHTADVLLVTAMERARPKQSSDISVYHRTSNDAQSIVILKNNRAKTYFQLSEIGYFIWEMLNGKHTIEDITIAVVKKFNIFSPHTITDAIFDLANAGFISAPKLSFLTNSDPPTSFTQRIKKNLYRFILINYTFNHLDYFFEISYKKFFHLFFTDYAKILLFIISVTGFILFLFSIQDITHYMAQIDHFIFLIMILYVTNIVCTIFHELGHAYATKACGRELNRAGVIFYWFGMFAFTDTSDMWLSTQKERISVSVAGPYTDIILAGIVSIVAWYIIQPDMKVFLWLLGLLLYTSAFKNLNPLYDGDGSKMITDCVNHSNLRTDAFTYFNKHSFLSIFHKQNSSILMYWLMIIVFFFIALSFAFIVQFYLLKILPSILLGIKTYYLSFLLPTYVLFNFIVTIWRAR